MGNDKLKLSKEENIKIGQQKRIAKLIASGKYHTPNIVECTCKLCGSEYRYDKDAKHNTKYHIKGYCSDKCYSKSGVKNIDRKITELRNLGIEVDESNADNAYKEYISKRVSASRDKWAKTIKERHGNDYFSRNAVAAVKTGRINFILKNNIVPPDKLKTMTDEEIRDVYNKYHNELTKHGEKIRAGRIEKNGGIEGFKESYRLGSIKAVERYMMSELGEEFVNSLSESEYMDAFNEYKHLFGLHRYSNISKDYHDKVKRTHLVNQCHMDRSVVDALSSDEVKRLYSEYLTIRIKSLSNTENNGYHHTSKGWYTLADGTPFFYRSSWEMELCKQLDKLLIDGSIVSVGCPDKVLYTFEGVLHGYFPDFKITFKSGNVLTVEVKPARKVDLPINQAKFKAAMETCTTFAIFTEDIIFSKDVLRTIKSYDI